MKNTSKVVFGIAALALGAVVACGSRASGKLVLGIKDGPPTSSDGRTISKLEIDIAQVEVHASGQGQQDQVDAGQHSDADAGQHSDAEENNDKDLVVFDAGQGAAKTVDLLQVTTFSALVANLTVPAGSYDGAQVLVTGARVVFADAPAVTVQLALEGDGHSKAEFDFHFRPAAVVSDKGTTLAVIDFVPLVTKDAAGAYRLGHDGENDKSGEMDNHHELEVKGTIATLDLAGHKLTLTGAEVGTIDFANATFKMHGSMATNTSLALGQKIEVEGTFDAATGAILATRIEIQ